MRQTFLKIGIIIWLFGLTACNNSTKENNNANPDSITQKLNPDNILFTTPTLENSLPDFENITNPENLQFHEDDWRQIEFVSKDQRSAIDKEILKIKDIYDNHSHKGDTYTAFKKVAVRELITQPLMISFDKIKTYLSDKTLTINGVSLFNNSGQVRNGFSFSVNGIHYYGELDNNKNVKWLCIHSADTKESLKSSVNNLARLLSLEKLYLVDWKQMGVFDETNIKTDFVN